MQDLTRRSRKRWPLGPITTTSGEAIRLATDRLSQESSRNLFLEGKVILMVTAPPRARRLHARLEFPLFCRLNRLVVEAVLASRDLVTRTSRLAAAEHHCLHPHTAWIFRCIASGVYSGFTSRTTMAGDSLF